MKSDRPNKTSLKPQKMFEDDELSSLFELTSDKRHPSKYEITK